jgi:hypothetical protein
MIVSQREISPKMFPYVYHEVFNEKEMYGTGFARVL